MKGLCDDWNLPCVIFSCNTILHSDVTALSFSRTISSGNPTSSPYDVTSVSGGVRSSAVTSRRAEAETGADVTRRRHDPESSVTHNCGGAHLLRAQRVVTSCCHERAPVTRKYDASILKSGYQFKFLMLSTE